MADTGFTGFYGSIVHSTDEACVTLTSYGRTVLTITADGRLLAGPGLSMDDATQAAAELLARHYAAAVQRVAPTPPPPDLDSPLFDGFEKHR